MQSIEKIIEYLEYGVSLSKWAISSLRGFPVWPKKGTKEGSGIKPSDSSPV